MPQRKLKKRKTLKTEHEDTWFYKGENFSEKIGDLQDRIGFIKEDIFNQEKREFYNIDRLWCDAKIIMIEDHNEK